MQPRSREKRVLLERLPWETVLCVINARNLSLLFSVASFCTWHFAFKIYSRSFFKPFILHASGKSFQRFSSPFQSGILQYLHSLNVFWTSFWTCFFETNAFFLCCTLGSRPLKVHHHHLYDHHHNHRHAMPRNPNLTLRCFVIVLVLLGHSLIQKKSVTASEGSNAQLITLKTP